MVPWNPEIARSIIAAHKDREGPLLPLLHAVQDAFGYVPSAAIPLIAEALNVTRAEVHGVVSFYHDFRTTPPGRHVLKLCQAESCQARGAERVRQQAERVLGVEIGHTSSDGRVTLEPVYCLGLCASGPSAMLDGKIWALLIGKRLEALLAEAKS